MFKSAEHAVATSMFMLSTPIYAKNGTQIVIDLLIEKYGREANIINPKTSLTPHEWRAQAVYVVNAIERTLGTNSPAYKIIIVEFGDIDAAEKAAKELLEIMEIPNTKGKDAQLQVECILSIFRSKLCSLRMLSDKYNVPKSNIHRFVSALRVMLYAYRRAGYLRLDHTFKYLSIVEDVNE